jgi:transcription initiation factor TFIIIB Brf1 subunit/transcription initiation factor TFIIB
MALGKGQNSIHHKQIRTVISSGNKKTIKELLAAKTTAK